MNSKTKKLTTTAMLCALAYLAVLVFRIPISTVEFLKYEPKDVLITIGGFLFGPLTSFLVSLVVAFIEMITISGTGLIGGLMNLISSCAFSCTAAAVYKKKRTLAGAVCGLTLGVFVMTGVMLMWNYLITPVYMMMPRDTLAGMLLPVFLPFNLLKGGLNMAVTLFLYRPVATGLRKAGLVEKSTAPKRHKFGILLIAGMLLLSCILFLMAGNHLI